MGQELERLNRRIEREISSRKAAEKILEEKALELYQVNEQLKILNEELEKKVELRSQALIETELRFRTLVESATDVIFNTNQYGIFTYINATGATLYGYSEDEVIGTHFLEYIHHEHKEMCFDHFTKMFDEKILETYFEFKVVRRDGKIIWVGQNTKRLESGSKVSYTAVARNITNQKTAEESLLKARELLQKSEQKYRSIIENMSLGILEVDLKGRIMRAHDQFCKMVGYLEEELVGQQYENFLINETFISKIQKERDLYQPYVDQVQIRKKDGRYIWVIISGAPFYDEYGEIAGTVGVHFDITPQKKLEKELESAKQIAESAQIAEKHFLASMSHEIRTPLNAIIGMAHLLKDTVLNKTQTEFLDILSSSANLLLSLISDILDISKIDAGVVEIQRNLINLKDLVQTIGKTFVLKLEEKGVDFSIYVDPKIDTQIYSDRLLLNQILMNLVGNAAKFTNSGVIRVNLIQSNKSENKRDITFEIIDTGIGIAEDKIEIIFDQFRQADSKIIDSYGGTGLGLSITKKIIELLGGEIKVKSKLGEGSTFYFTLSLEDSGQSAESKQQAQSNEGKILENISTVRQLLIVEDNPMNQKYISTLLTKWKINFDMANNGLEAVELCKDRSYDLIFMDLQMPVMNGIEATEIILKGEFNKNTPIIALTASTFLSKKEVALASGMVDFLSKPFTPDQLNNIMERHSGKNERIMPIEKKKETFQFSRALDYEFLEQVYEDDLDYAHDIFEAFIDSYREEYDLLQKAIAEGNYAEVKRVAHKMKPTFSMVGLPELSNNLEKLEKLGAIGDGDEINKYNLQLIQLLSDKIGLVEMELQKLKSYK